MSICKHWKCYTFYLSADAFTLFNRFKLTKTRAVAGKEKKKVSLFHTAHKFATRKRKSFTRG